MIEVSKIVLPESCFFEDCFFLDLPQGAEILVTQGGYGESCIYALVNSKNPTETRKFCLLRDDSISDDSLSMEKQENLKYIGSLQKTFGSFIGHLFEIKE
jgi:hypothetical protein